MGLIYYHVFTQRSFGKERVQELNVSGSIKVYLLKNKFEK